MKVNKFIATYRRLRFQSHWRLLAADNAPVIIGLLQAHFFDGEQSLPASILHDRLGRDIEDLRARGEALPQTAQGYIADWLAAGFLERRFRSGATEEEYELSAAAADAIRFAINLVEPRTSATESRLSTVIHQLIRLAEETDPNPESRINALLKERENIDRQIAVINKGQLRVLSEIQSLERIREIILLADNLTGDFRHVRDEFEQLNRSLRERIMDNDGSRGEALEALFAGVDLISESEAGRTFSAFWRLLTDPEQNASLDQALEQVISRDFVQKLKLHERRFLLNLTRSLLDQGGMVHEVLQHFARSLKHFVQSREYLEQRRLNQLLKEGQRAALALKDEVKVTESLEYTLQLTSSRLRSVSQWVLHDPSLQAIPESMRHGEAPNIDLQMVGELMARSEIDFRTLKANVRATLLLQSQASIGEVLARFPATQGLGSVVGLVALGSRYGHKANESEKIIWCGEDEQQRSATIPIIYFLRERSNELV